MKKVIRNLVVFLFSLLLVSCGLFGGDNNPSTSSQGPGTGEKNEMFECNYNNDGLFEFINFKHGTIKILIDGKEYIVNEETFDAKSLGLDEGVYVISVYFYEGVSLTFRQSYDFHYGEDYGSFMIAFYDFDMELIKEIRVDENTIFDNALFPSYENKTGVTYSWEYDVPLGSKVNRDINVYLQAEYIDYDINYVLNGGTFGDADVVDFYNVGILSLDYPIPYKEGFIFDGWYNSNDFSGEKVTGCDTQACKDVTIYAKWIEQSSEVKDIISIFNSTIAQEKLTIKAKIDGVEAEIAYDQTGSSFYYHSKNKSGFEYVIMDNIYYYYEDNTYIVKNPDIDDYKDPISLSNIAKMLTEASVKTSGTTITYTSNIKDYDMQVVVVVKDNVLSKITFSADKYKEEYEFIYECKKANVDKSKFTEKIEVNFYLLEIRNGNKPTANFQGNEFIKKGIKLIDIERISKYYENVHENFGGFYLDEEMTKLIRPDYIVNSSIDIYAVDYGNFEEILDVYEFTLNVHCDCKECKSEVKKYEDITYSELSEVKHLENYDKDPEPFHLIEEGKEIMGWFEAPNKESGEINIYALINEHLFNGRFYDELVIDIYTHTIECDTVKVKEVCNCDLHADLGYNEIYAIKGSWYFAWTNKHELDGFMCKEISLHEDLSSAEEGFTLDDDCSIYYVWEKDTRVNVKVHGGFDKYGEGHENIYMESQYIYDHLRNMYSGIHDGMMAEGFYLDEEFTNPYTKDTILEDNIDIYIKWTQAKQITLIFINGNEYSLAVPKGFNINSFDWSIYTGRREVTENASFTDNIFNYVYQASMSSDSYLSIFEFYKDESRNVKLDTFDNVDRVYVGYKEHPTVTIKCDDDCNLNDFHQTIYSFYIREQEHQLYIGDEYYRIVYYKDPEFKEKMSSEYLYYPYDFELYGKKELVLHNFDIDCRCLVHGNEGVKGQFNSLAIATKNCDYGYGNSVEISYYVDKNYQDRFNFNPNDIADCHTLFVKVDGKATVYCDCGLKGHDGKGFDVSLVYGDHEQVVYEWIERYHYEALMGAPFEFRIYVDEEMKEQYMPGMILHDGAKLYCDINIDENYVPVTITYNDISYTHFYMIGNYINLPVGFDEYVITDYYLDKELTKHLEYEWIENNPTAVVTEEMEIFCKYELAKKAEFQYVEDGQVRTMTKYLYTGNEIVWDFYMYVYPEYGYMAYVVDPDGHIVYNYDLLKEGVYTIKQVELDGYIEITLICECDFCNNETGVRYNTYENGTRAGVAKDNKLLVEKDKPIVRYLYEHYPWHSSIENSSDLREMIISLTQGGEPLSMHAFDYYYDDKMPDEVEYKFIYSEDTTLYLRFRY